MSFLQSRVGVLSAGLAGLTLAFSAACLTAQDKGMAPMNPMADHGMMDAPKPMSDKMVGEAMGMMNPSMMTAAAKAEATRDVAKMMMVRQMAMQVCTDEKCMAMMSEPAMAAMMKDAQSMLADEKQMAQLREEIAKDPAMMKMVMTASMADMAMMHSMAPTTQPAMTPSMGGDHGMMGGQEMAKPAGEMKPTMKPGM